MGDDKPARLRGLSSAWKGAGTVVAVIASGVALAFTVSPSLAPDPGTITAASMSVATVDRGVSDYDFLTQYQPTGLHGLTPGQVAQTKRDFGSVLFVHVQVEGKKHSGVQLDYVSYDAHTKLQVPGSENTPLGAVPETPNDAWIAPVFVTDPVSPAGAAPMAYFVRLRLYASGVMLAYADSPPIASRAP